MSTGSFQKAIEISAELYRVRELLVFIRTEDAFKQDVAKWKPVFEKIMAESNCGVLEALIKLLDRAKDEYDPGVLMHLLSAVGCELAEPKYTKE